MHNQSLRKPAWLRRKLPAGPEFEQVRTLLRQGRLHTVCQAAACPNIWECFGQQQTATFLIMGNVCTRNCRFCAVEKGPLLPPDPDEPQRVAQAAKTLQLKYVVITSVTRDDLPDGGASHFSTTITAVRQLLPDSRIEVLIPDFKGQRAALQTVIEAAPDVLNHNIETVRRLYPAVRPQAGYEKSLELFRQAGKINETLPLKSGMMLGLGEKDVEIMQTLQDLYGAGCRMLTLGQYLQPSPSHLPVIEYIAPEQFEAWRTKALKTGFTQVASGPLVRSSYHARDLFHARPETPVFSDYGVG